MGSIIVRLKTKENYSHVIQEHVKSSASEGYLTHFKTWYGVKNVKLADRAGSADQKAADFFLIFAKCYVEKVMCKSRLQCG